MNQEKVETKIMVWMVGYQWLSSGYRIVVPGWLEVGLVDQCVSVALDEYDLDGVVALKKKVPLDVLHEILGRKGDIALELGPDSVHASFRKPGEDA
jgi:hypothetical protein